MVEKRAGRGRPSKTRERRAQIVEAFLGCIARQGLRATSMGSVAAELGLDRTTLHHYFHSRAELVAAAMERVINAYQQGVERITAPTLAAEERVLRLLDHAFSADFNDPGLSDVLAEFALASRDDPKARAELQRAYRTFEDTALGELEKRYPGAPERELRRVAYSIVQLSEGSSAFAAMGFGPDRTAAARETAEQLLQQLERSPG